MNLIKWEGEGGETQRLYLMQRISPRWRDIGELINLPFSRLDNIATVHVEPLDRCRAVLSCWLENPPKVYPITWSGLLKLLEDCELGQVVSELKVALSKSKLE